MNTLIAIVQARMQSQRLPGKVMRPLLGKPSIYYVLERAKRIPGVSAVVLATSTNKENDALADYARSIGHKVFRGSEDDVLGRFVACLEAEEGKYEYFTRLCADNFLFCPSIVEASLKKLEAENLSIVNPFLEPSYPFGSGAEVAKTDVLPILDSATQGSEVREHVLFYAYKNSLVPFAGLDAPSSQTRNIKLSVDTEEDFLNLENFFLHMGSPEKAVASEIGDLVSYYDSHPYYRRAAEADSALLLNWRNDPLTRKGSLTTHEVQPEEHEAWYKSSLASPSRRIFIVEMGGKPVGTVRLDEEGGSTELSWTTAPESRGKGIGTQMVKGAFRFVKTPKVTAKIKPENAASLRIAESAGFRLESQKDGVNLYARARI